jgi:proteasome lid subunit RPN8/RPN11
MAEKLILTRKTWQAMRRHVSRGAPLEACGLLAGKKEQVEQTLGIRNIERSAVRFRMDPRAQWRAFQQMEAAGLELNGIYHSHPQGPDHPSRIDIAESLYPVPQIIWFRLEGRWRGRGFRIQDGKVTEISLEVIDPE